MAYAILYVDDERPNLVSFKATFRTDFQVFIAQTGTDALDILSKESIDLVVTDQRMPGMTGVELLAKVRQLQPDSIRMILTGYSDMSAIIDAINKGNIYYYISKPWKADEMRLIFDKALETRNLQQAHNTLSEAHASLQLKSEQQEKAHLVTQLETLKEQLNPHFLFNCLNALASLVHDEPDIAEKFITRMTRVYRYLLEQHQAPLISLAEELRFLQDYIYLQQIRFADSLRIDLDIPASAMEKQIPPLTLQLLAENAVKHNVISRSKPLVIQLFVNAGGNLEMRNTLQPRQDKAVSTKVGLQNLRERYRLLSEVSPQFGAQGDTFVAVAPLL